MSSLNGLRVLGAFRTEQPQAAAAGLHMAQGCRTPANGLRCLASAWLGTRAFVRWQ